MNRLIPITAVSVFIGMVLAMFVAGTGLTPRKLWQQLSPTYQQRTAVQKVVNDYYKAWEVGQPEKMYLLLSKIDQQNISKEKYVTDFKEFPLRPTHHEIISIKLKRSSALIKVNVYWPKFETDGETASPELVVLIKQKSQWKITEKPIYEENEF
jgi:hypothetical protein